MNKHAPILSCSATMVECYEGPAPPRQCHAPAADCSWCVPESVYAAAYAYWGKTGAGTNFTDPSSIARIITMR